MSSSALLVVKLQTLFHFSVQHMTRNHSIYSSAYDFAALSTMSNMQSLCACFRMPACAPDQSGRLHFRTCLDHLAKHCRYSSRLCFDASCSATPAGSTQFNHTGRCCQRTTFVVCSMMSKTAGCWQHSIQQHKAMPPEQHKSVAMLSSGHLPLNVRRRTSKVFEQFLQTVEAHYTALA